MSESLLQFENVSFFYPRIEEEPQGSVPTLAAPEQVTSVFQHLTLSVPGGVVSLVGENGIGKTTFLLLAGARIFPAEGRVLLAGQDTARFKEARDSEEAEQERNRLVSFVYENMEFETEESIGELMGYIFETGMRESADSGLLEELREVLELDRFLDKKLQV
ncbi:ATP-binding cassette domain-containing protein, partial [Salinispira pacifica]